MSRIRTFGPGAGTDFEPPNVEGPLPRTALPVIQGLPRHLEAHLLRLQAGARAMGHRMHWLPGLQGDLTTWLGSTLPGEDAALRLILHPDAGLLKARLEPLPMAPDPCRLAPMPHPLGARRWDPVLVHKGLSGGWWVDILREARDQGAEDALLLWPDGSLAETAMASVAVEQDGVLWIPPPQGRVASLAERLDLPGWARARSLRIEVRELSLARARDGRIWCMNALRGIWAATLL